jgi:hypothetical protein
MTYKELRDKMTEEQKNCDVTRFDSNFGEYLTLTTLEFATESENDVLDDGHPFLSA